MVLDIPCFIKILPCQDVFPDYNSVVVGPSICLVLGCFRQIVVPIPSIPGLSCHFSASYRMEQGVLRVLGHNFGSSSGSPNISANPFSTLEIWFFRGNSEHSAFGV